MNGEIRDRERVMRTLERSDGPRLKSAIIGSRRTIFCTALLFIICLMGSSTSNVYATSVNIIQVQYPSTVTYGSSGRLDIKVHVQAAFYPPQPNTEGQLGVLVVEIANLDNNSAEISGPGVTATSQPTPCLQAPSWAPSEAQCALVATSANFDEIFDFTLSNSYVPASPFWHLGAYASAMGYCSTCTAGLSRGGANFNFTIIVLQPYSSTTLPSYSTPTFSSVVTTSSIPVLPASTVTSTVYVQSNQPELQLAVVGIVIVVVLTIVATWIALKRRGKPRSRSKRKRK